MKPLSKHSLRHISGGSLVSYNGAQIDVDTKGIPDACIAFWNTEETFKKKNPLDPNVALIKGLVNAVLIKDCMSYTYIFETRVKESIAQSLQKKSDEL